MTRFDAPILVSDRDPRGGYRPDPVPGPDVTDLRDSEPVPDLDEPIVSLRPGVGGSKAWAVAGSSTAGPGALLASDPRVNRTVPTIFYRTELHLEGRAAYGASIPVLPGMIFGATGDLAWGTTDAPTDQVDFVVVEVDPSDTTRHLTSDGSESFGTRREVIPVRGGDQDTVAVRRTRWGPITE